MKTEASFRGGGRLANVLAILGLGLLFLALRWNSYDAPLIRDEGEYAYAAQLLVHGVMPYEHAFIQKPPNIIYSYALANLLVPGIFWAPRLLAYLSVALATVLLGYIARWEFGKGFALPAMWLITPMVLLPEVDQFIANTEMFMLLPLLATFAIYVRARHDGQKMKYWLAAGFLGITTLGYKYTALPLVGFVFAVWSVELWWQSRDPRLLGRAWLAAISGGILAVVLELGCFLIHDGGARLWECTVLFNRYYVASNNFSLAYFWSRVGTFWNGWWILFFIPWAVFLQKTPRLWFWSGAFASALLATSASGYSQYYIVLMPFWALLGAVGIRTLAAYLAERSTLSVRLTGGLLTAAVLFLVMRPDLPWLACSRERFVAAKIGGYPFIGSLVVAQRVAELSSPGEFVYVAGSEPQILFYAQRFSPTRFITTYAMMIPTALAEKYQQEAIASLQAYPPKLIVFTEAGNSWLRQADTPPDFLSFLSRFLQQNYVPVGGYLPGRQNGRWAEPLATNEMADANLVLFVRKPAP